MMDIDSMCEQMGYSTLERSASFNFMKDYNIIIDSIGFNIQELYHQTESEYSSENCQICSLQNIDIYDILVSCGSSLTWNMDYQLTQNDFQWLKIKGKEYFFSKLNKYVNLNNISNYYSLLPCYTKLVELFELQVVE